MIVAFYLFEPCLTHVVADRVGWVEAILLPVVPGCRRAVHTHVINLDLVSGHGFSLGVWVV